MPEENLITEPIINSPYEEPMKHWHITANEPPQLVGERRKATYFYFRPNTKPTESGDGSIEIEIHNITEIRSRLGEWRELAMQGRGGATRVTAELLKYWRREGRKQPLFFAQLEAAETIIFLTEALHNFTQGIKIPKDEPSDEKKDKQFSAFDRRCCKMATGVGKTTVMAMLAAWSILNKVNNPRDSRYSNAVLAVCPNVTIRDRLAELDPKNGDASIYRTRDLVPARLMPQLKQGKVMTTNWHVFEPRSPSSAKVVKTGKWLVVNETVYIGDENKTLRGKRYMTQDDLETKAALNLLDIKAEHRDKAGFLKRVEIESVKYEESDKALVRRVLGREIGNLGNILVLNDEAHHAYRLRHDDKEEKEGNEGEFADELLGDDGETDYYYKEATVWIDGLDKIHKLRGINQCIDFSATPYFLGKAGKDTNRIFPWTVSNFGLSDAIEAGLVKIPQLAARDPSGDPLPGYFNIWDWLMPRLSAAERGGKKSEAKPSAVLRYAHAPIAMLGGMWETMRQEMAEGDDPRPPVFIIVCKNIKLAEVIYNWLANDRPPTPGIPRAGLPTLRNNGVDYTVRIDSKVQSEIDSGNTKSDEARWMRHLLDTVGKTDWLRDAQGNKLYPSGFEQLAKKMGREQFLEYPPGRDIRCIVSVGMLTEGWDCNTVTHIIGLRPFMSQLLCEQVIGRGLRRMDYETDENGMMKEEVAKVLGVPLSLYPVKAGEGERERVKVTRHHIYAIPQKEEEYGITFPRVEGYRQMVRKNLTCNMKDVPPVVVDVNQIPEEVEMAVGLPDNEGRIRLGTPGGVAKATMEDFYGRMRMQQRMFEMTKALMENYDALDLPNNMLFAQLYKIVSAYVAEKVKIPPSSDIKNAFMSPYYGYIISTLKEYIRPDESLGEQPELPRYEEGRAAGKTGDVDFYTRRQPYEIMKSHINALVPDTEKLEQRVGYRLDNNKEVQAFVKNEGLGFAIPYFHNGVAREYMPDFLIRLQNREMLILETKGFDPAEDAKKSAAKRWVKAINADKQHGKWHYHIIKKEDDLDGVVDLCSG